MSEARDRKVADLQTKVCIALDDHLRKQVDSITVACVTNGMDADDLSDLIDDMRANNEAQKQYWHNYIERIAELEARPSLKACGVWESDRLYLEGHLVVHDGSSWVAKTSTRGEQPGNGRTGWQLLAQRGRSGRDARP